MAAGTRCTRSTAAPATAEALSPGVGHAHRQLAEVASLEQADERLGGVFQAVGAILAQLQLARLHVAAEGVEAFAAVAGACRSLQCAITRYTGTRGPRLGSGSTASNTAPPTFSK